METEDLIRRLSVDLESVPSHAIARRLGGTVVAGALVALMLVVTGLGLRPDLANAICGTMFWLKLGYTASIGLGALLLTAHLARPEASRVGTLKWLLIPIAVMVFVALVEILKTPVAVWGQLLLGESWQVCPFLIFGLAVPIYLGLIVAFRRFAPSRLMATGGVAGLAAGGLAAAIYCLHCPEDSALFVLVWYSLGIVLAALVGALAGMRLLRW